MILFGVDSCPAGWVVVTSDAALMSIEFDIVGVSEIGRLFERCAAAGGQVAIDIPIGLPDSGSRRCDLAARNYLRTPRASSVFPAPCRATLPAGNYAEACALNIAACGRKLSLQTFGILGRIRCVDEAISPELQRSVRESHPEVVFARLSGEDRGLELSKKTLSGCELRQRLLWGHLPGVDVDAARARLGRSRVAPDDLLDALACLIAAQHLARGEALVLPGGPIERDRRGLRMEIVA